RSFCASKAVAVLLPFVPVTQTLPCTTPSTPARPPNHNAVPPRKRVPCAAAAMASAPYGLMPGDLTTTAYAERRPALASGSITRPGSSASASAASAALQNSARPAGAPSPLPGSRSARQAARPSRPQPQSATRFPSSREMRTQLLPRRGRDPVLARRLQQWRDRQSRRVELRQDLALEAAHQRVLAPLRAVHQREHRRARLAALAHAFEGLVVAEL